jgi:tol-pal system protein YbgF
MMRARGAAIVAAVLVTGCLASKGDVALLQTQLTSMTEASARANEAQRAHVDQVLAQIARTNDSIRVLSTRLAKFQGDVQNDHYQAGQQMVQIQELLGQSQRRIQELRASLEEKAATPAAPAPGDTTRAAAQPGAPGAGQLFQNSFDQLRRGSTSVARSGFEELLRTYPGSQDAPEAMIYIAQTYEQERNQVAADSVYGLVVKQYPKSPKAATALYKQAQSLAGAGQTAKARALYQRIQKEYPGTDEADLATSRLRTLK